MTESYFSQGHGIDQISVNKKKKKSVSIPTLIISMISIAFVVVLVMAKMDDIKGFFGDDSSDIVETVKHLQIGDEVAYSGIVNTDGDMQNYTHTYNSEFGKIGLKSYKFDLNKYKGELYKDLKIVFTEGNSSFQYYYNKFDGGSYTGNTFLQSGKYSISEILGDNNRNLRNVNIIFYPYELGCKISAVEQSSNRTNNNSNNPISSLKIKFLVNDNEDYCVKLSSDLCKIERIDCF